MPLRSRARHDPIRLLSTGGWALSRESDVPVRVAIANGSFLMRTPPVGRPLPSSRLCADAPRHGAGPNVVRGGQAGPCLSAPASSARDLNAILGKIR